MKSSISFVFAFTYLGFCTSINAQELPDIRFKTLNVKDGLSSSTINDILKDDFGYMWFATDDGLNKFDGLNFTVYRHHPNDSGSLTANEVADLFLDDSGNVWVCTNNGFVSMYDRKKDKFVNISLKGGKGKSLAADQQGRIWIGGYTDLMIYDPKTKTLVSAHKKWKNGYTPGQRIVLCLLKDHKGQMWLGTDRGLFVYRPATDTFQQFEPHTADATSLADRYVKSLVEDARGNLWVGTGGGLGMLAPDRKAFRNILLSGKAGQAAGSNIVYSLALEGEKRLWIGTEDGLAILDLASGRVSSAGKPNIGPYHLSGKSVRAILVDKHGLFWIGTFQGGVSKYDKNLALFDLRQANPADPNGLSASTVTSFIENGKDDLYIGTDGGGLNLYHRNTETFDHVALPTAASGRNLSIMVMEKIDGKIWIGTYFDGLFIFDPKTGRAQHIQTGPQAGALSNNNIFCIKQDRRGRVWIGTNGGGINIYDPTTRTFERFNARMAQKPGNDFRLNGYVRSIEEDQQGKIWIASVGTGLAIYDPASDKTRTLDTANSRLSSNTLLSIAAGPNGNIWLGTAGGGLCWYDAKKGDFLTYSEQEGLANAVIHKILVGDDDRLWLSTNKGISSFDIRQRKFRNYSYNNGLQRNTFVLGSGRKLSTGELFFGGVEGFNFFDPKRLNINKNQPKIILTDLKVANHSVVPDEGAPISEHISEAREVHLDYKQSFSISFAALNYTSPEECLFSYKLDGFDKNWNEVGRSTTASYTNLDPGSYTFHVRARSEAGWWTTTGTSIKIYVRPPFWKTTFAYLVYLLAGAGLLWVIRYRGIKKLEEKFALEQERREARRLMDEERREAERVHEMDQVKLKFLTNLSHDFRTPISLIMGPVEKLLLKENNHENAVLLQMIRRNSKRLLNLVNQLLDYRKLEEQELKLNLCNGDIVAFIHDVAESFRDVADRKHISFVVSSSIDHYPTSFDHDKVERLLFNLLSNAFKFTFEHGRVTLDMQLAEQPDRGIVIRIADTGIGIRKAAQEKIFDRFFQSPSTAFTTDQGSGIGLAITREFVRMHGGTVNVSSEVGKGSTFLVFLPLDLTAAGALPGALSSELADSDYLESPHNAPDQMTVLLVEDSEDFRFYLKDNLKNHYRVIEAVNGKEGWQKALAYHPQLIVSDVNMPLMDGFELCKKIKADRRTSQIPVILLTALHDQEVQVKGLETGANDYITKPFNFEILRVKIDNLVKMNQSLKDTYTRQIKMVGSEIKVELEEEKLMAKIMAYIESKLTDPQLSVEDLSRHVGMSRGSLYRRIVDLTGETPVEFIRSIKLEKAAFLLEKSDMRISQIGYAVGFSTPNYFAKAFKTKYNMLPSEYIQQKRSPDETRNDEA